ncbi:MAG: hypothetical protein MI923_27165, partial [Phycisphaerales bacterium]|nr:hypothetical protein [Phycisphaerales bacterium]
PIQRVNEASFFEVTTSRSREDVNGFHNVTFGPGGKPVISRCLLSLIGQLSFLLIPNTVLSLV